MYLVYSIQLFNVRIPNQGCEVRVNTFWGVREKRLGKKADLIPNIFKVCATLDHSYRSTHEGRTSQIDSVGGIWLFSGRGGKGPNRLRAAMV